MKPIDIMMNDNTNIDNNFTLNKWIENMYTMARNNIMYLMFLFLLSMIYIFNNHQALKLVREINLKSKQLKELRWEYLTNKSDLMFQSKLTEVLPKAKKLGLMELDKPPYIINLKTKYYQRQK